MLKSIKTTKQMRLDELIKYIYNENIENKTFTDLKNEVEVSTNIFGSVSITNKNNPKLFVSHNRLFTVELEEQITEDTVFKCLLEIIDGELVYIRNKKTIKESVKDDTDRFYALIDGKLQLVWERDGE